ncbi:unnamed protein product, partial [Ectocarpus sp. 6 AP-2014]
LYVAVVKVISLDVHSLPRGHPSFLVAQETHNCEQVVSANHFLLETNVDYVYYYLLRVQQAVLRSKKTNDL